MKLGMIRFKLDRGFYKKNYKIFFMAAILFFTVNAKKMFFIKIRFVENNVRK